MAEQKQDRVTTMPGQLPINQETLDILVANIIPTSKYFEARFDHMEDRINRMQDDITDFRSDVDKRFEQVGKRFEQVDKRFEQIINSIDKLADKQAYGFEKLLEKLDHRDERQRNFTLRMFTLSITISILGVTAKQRIHSDSNFFASIIISNNIRPIH